MSEYSASSARVLRPEWILTPEGLRGGLELVLEGDRIRALRPQSGAAEAGILLLPGFVNAHSHAFQRGLRGHVQHAAGPDDFWSWRERMYTLANGLDPEGVEVVSALAFAEMALAGFTSVGEFHYLHHQPGGAPYADPDELAWRVLAAAERVGLRIALLRVAYARAGAGRSAEPQQRRFVDASPEASLEALERLRGRVGPRVSLGLAPHSVRALPGAWLEVLSAWPGVVHAHVAEQPAEREASRAEHGLEPLAVFERAGLLSGRFTAVHLTWPAADDAERLRRAGARVCVCPSTELDLGDGFYRAEALGGVPVCVGSDSHALIDPFAELRALEWHSRARLGRRNVLTPPGDPDALALHLLACGAEQGARSLGLETGTIAPGQLADLVALDLNDPALCAARPLPAVVFGASPRAVRHSWVGGQPVVVDGRLPGFEALARRAAGALAAL